MRAYVLLLCLAVGTFAADEKQAASPIDKVISMMNDMMVKAKQEKQDEKMRFAAFEQFCKSETVARTKAIEKGTDDVAAAEAEMAAAASDADGLAKEIAAHEKDIATWTSDKEASVDLRAEEHAVFEKAHAQTVDDIESTDAAMATLEEGNEAVPQALVQLSTHPRLSTRDRKVITSFIQFDPAAALLQDKQALAGTPEAAAFEGSSGAVIGVVDSLSDKLLKEKKELEEREGNSLNAHNLQVASLNGQIKKATMESDLKASMKAEREQDGAEAKGEHSDATATLAEDKKFLSDLTAECELKTTDFHKRQEMRAGEIKAVTKAIEIMSSDDLGLVQSKARPRSFAQLRSATERGTAQHIAARFLSDRAKKSNSRVLSLLAVRAASDPFAKVVKMIKDMIQRLMEEANSEAEHKAFCDAEMATNKLTRDTKTAQIAELQATIEQLQADINKFAEAAAETTAAIGEIDAAVTKATADRQAEKEKNTAAIDDAKVAEAAVQRATAVLKEYYDKAANQVDLPKADGPIDWDPRSLKILSTASGGASFVQHGQKQKVPGAPEMESGKYTGQEGGGVMGMLEIIESDFASLISETEASEAEAVRVYEQFMTDSNQDKAVKETDLKHQQDRKTQKESDLQQAKVDLKDTQKELQSATDYFDKLKPTCVEEAASYEETVAARQSEIDSLQEALKILSGDDIA